ncbi:hypothetical protein Ahu01nite_075840 [Winogradskya humida]|uniref:Uncharacterized protein n=1 Tax=Winogradskya humida TaxID=113566 RepID=A0ABQ4A0W8_9ACTN|nr:hypothetical protein Ahu01nite_075840 [Actinoplanes humidus]
MCGSKFMDRSSARTKTTFILPALAACDAEEERDAVQAVEDATRSAATVGTAKALRSLKFRMGTEGNCGRYARREVFVRGL